MRGDYLRKFLEQVEDGAIDAATGFSAFLSAGYGASPGKIMMIQRKLKRQYKASAAEAGRVALARQKYARLLYRLKEDGILRIDQEDRKMFSLTKKGETKLKALSEGVSAQANLSSSYPAETGGPVTIVAFDVPEKERRKRNWLRTTLAELGMQKIQMSVWVGKIKLPKEFLEDINKLRMVDYLEIFEVTKTGSLKKI